jgi:hypothetical protein
MKAAANEARAVDAILLHRSNWLQQLPATVPERQRRLGGKCELPTPACNAADRR